MIDEVGAIVGIRGSEVEVMATRGASSSMVVVEVTRVASTMVMVAMNPGVEDIAGEAGDKMMIHKQSGHSSTCCVTETIKIHNWPIVLSSFRVL